MRFSYQLHAVLRSLGRQNWFPAFVATAVTLLFLTVATCSPSFVLAKDTQPPAQRLVGVKGLARIELLAELVDELRNTDPAAAVRYGKEGLRLLQSNPNPTLQVDILNEMSWAYRVLGENTEALRVANESLVIAQDNSYGRGLARAFNNIGGVYYFLGDYELALENSVKALEIRETSNDQSGIAASISNIGLLYAHLGNTDAAIENFLRALAISEKTGNPEHLVNHLHNLGEVYIETGQLDSADKYLQRGLLIAKESGYRKGEVDTLLSLGRLNLQTGNLAQADQDLKAAFLIAKEIGWRSIEANVLHTLAQVSLKRGYPDDAMASALNAMSIANSLGERGLLIKLHQMLSELYEADDNHADALAHYKILTTLQEQQFEQQRQEKITRLQVRYEAAEQAKEIALLRKDQAIKALELEASKTNQRDWQIAVGVLLLLAVILFAGYRQRAKHLERRSIIAGNYEKLLHSLPLGVLSVDGSDEIWFANDSLSTITEHQQSALMKLKEQAYTMLINNEAVADFSLPLEGGPPKSLLLAVSQRANERGASAGFWLIATDLTQQRQTYAQLVQASKLATLGEMSTGMAHELNQPLNVISLATSNLRFAAEKGRATNDSLLTKLTRIEGAVNRAASIIDHMRAYGRVAGDSFSRIDVRDVINNACDLLRESLALKSVELTTILPDSEVIIMGNAIQLEQVILNLINNAKDAILSNGVSGSVKVEADVSRDRVTIKVTDTGGGIPDDVLPHLFEPFFTTKPVGKGTGLGGSISYGIVRDMQGDIWAENVEGGAQLNVSLPLAQ